MPFIARQHVPNSCLLVTLIHAQELQEGAFVGFCFFSSSFRMLRESSLRHNSIHWQEMIKNSNIV